MWCRGLRISGVAAAVVQVASAVARVRFLVQELLHTVGAAKKKKRKRNIKSNRTGYKTDNDTMYLLLESKTYI